MRKRLATAVGLLTVAVSIGVIWLVERPASSATKARTERPVPVQTAVAEQRSIPEVLAVQGFVAPEKVVEIRPQVMSSVRAVDTDEGQTVRTGQRMFTLDDRNDAANAAKAAALVGKDGALLADARRALARNLDLKAKGFVSQSAVDTAQSNADALRATLASDRAAATAADVTRGFSVITAPMAGRVGEIKVHVGSLVQPNGLQPMATITQLDPIDVAFNVPERDVQKLLAAQRKGAVTVSAIVDGKRLSGRLIFIDSAVDQATGSLKAKGAFVNGDHLLWPGSLVDVELPLRTIADAVVVSPRAIQVGPSGQFVYRVEHDGRVLAQAVTVDYLTRNVAVVSGLAAGSRVVVEGGQNLRAGVLVVDVNAAARP